jgi:DHA1 family bicyclomycin/chloramphenicol resistance-like MFS transporter
LLVWAIAADGVPPFWSYMIGFGVLLAIYAMVFPNSNTIAMDPMGKVAGMASAVIGVISIAGGAIIGAVLDRLIEATVTPLAAGFFVTAAVALAIVFVAERGRLFVPLKH